MRLTSSEQIPCSFRFLGFQENLDKSLWMLHIKFLSFRLQTFRQIIINYNLRFNKNALF